MRKPSIGEWVQTSYTETMMNRINFESVENLNRQRFVRFICSLFFVGLLGGGCVSSEWAHDSHPDRYRGGNGQNFRNYPYQYHNGNGYNHYPYNGGRSSFQSPHHGGGHNPLHVPAGRYHNMGNPGKWRL
ncbi:hypothetical protein [Leptospira perdikensis]|uniref:Uncharacterized protein n=1 Tax=Leptospira perdikensis TaxID=2484948 RepID=A0A4R9JKP7_9LEPT|nr:hypothetical protein [Leptospira perdikensis]TGL44868.1 hypothetical protein EHQ49_05230 [Leptospira perdikensis]